MGSVCTASSLPPGAYDGALRAQRFRATGNADFEVQLGRTYDLDASLKVGNISEAVQVTAENAPLVDTRSTIIAHNVTAEEIDRLPKGRSFQSIALTAPSVNSGEIEGGFQVNGASGAENAFTVDGVNTTSLVNGGSRQNTVFEYIQEVQVKTTGIPAEFGGALGGVISAVTKSGGNIFTGEGHYYFDGSPLSAGPVKRLVLSPIDDKTVTYVQDESSRTSATSSAGRSAARSSGTGCSSSDRSRRASTRATNDYMFSSGTDPGEIERTTKLIQAFGKVSIGSRRVNAYVYGARHADLRRRARCWRTTASAPHSSRARKAASEPNIERGWEQMQVNTTGNVDVVISNGAYATFRGGYFHDRYTDTGIPNTTSWTYQTPRLRAGLARRCRRTCRDRSSRQHAARADHELRHDQAQHLQRRLQPHVPGCRLAHAEGRRRISAHRTTTWTRCYPGGYVYIFWDSSTGLAGQTPDRGTFGYYEVNNLGTIGKAGANIISLYIQDQWQIGDRLTLNLGVRTERRERSDVQARNQGERDRVRLGRQDRSASRV